MPRSMIHTDTTKYYKKDHRHERLCGGCDVHLVDGAESRKDKNLCKECAGEICPNNYKHTIMHIEGGNIFCINCNRKYEIKGYKLPDVDAKIIPI